MILETSNYPIYFTTDLAYVLEKIIAQYPKDKIFLLTDQNVEQKVLPQIPLLQQFKTFVLPAGEQHKSLEQAAEIWKFLLANNADRYSLLINLGGGVVTDIGGFAASVFKRGIDFINIPTTLLAQVDAAIGGKTAVDFMGYKNQLGTFSFPKAVIINTHLLQTLDKRQFISGYAEMIKHALISSQKDWAQIKAFDVENIDFDFLLVLVKKSVEIKVRITEQDPYDRGWRKVLNFGHTVGHGIEAYFLQQGVDILHGEAVAIGLVCEIYLSNRKLIFPLEKVLEISAFISRIFPAYRIPYNDYEKVLEKMRTDKKNKAGNLIFTLLKNIGEPQIDQVVEPSDVIESFNFYRQFTVT